MARRPLATDELPDRWVARPLAAVLVRVLAPTPITANQVTVGSALAGVAAGVFLARGDGVIFAWAILAMLVLDCADGQLARLRGGGGVWGRIVDGLGDYVTGAAIHVGLIVHLVETERWLPGLAWGVGAGVSMAWNAYLMDRAKRRYRGDTDDLDEVRRAHDEARGLKRVVIGWFRPYAGRIAGGTPIPDREAYKDRLRPVMSLWLWVGPTTHVTAFALLAALERPLVYAWAACIPFNVVALTALLLQSHLERRQPAVVGGAEKA